MQSIILLCCIFVGVWAGIDLSRYTLTFSQDFTTLSSLGVTSEGPITASKPWIAHRAPRQYDWVNFQDPGSNFQPFSLDGGFLTIRVQRQTDGSYTAGLLSTMDKWGNGFSQKYGYFECSAKLPQGLGAWPAFWLVDRDSIVNSNSDAHELDILEQYGDGPALLTMTRHYWSNTSIPTWGAGTLSVQPDMETGFHLYGMDYQADFLTFYYDREIISQIPNVIDAGSGKKYDRAMYVMINNAYGGGGSANQPNPALNTGGPRDMQVKYVKVWQGSGGSSIANSNTNGANQYAFGIDGTLQSNLAGIQIKGMSLNISSTGELIIYQKPSNSILWRNNVNTNCGSFCKYIFQGDGNFVGYGASGAVWGTSTYGMSAAAVRFQNTAPFLSVVNQYGSPVWQANAATIAPTIAPTPKPTPVPTVKPTPAPTPKPTLPPSNVWSTAQFTLLGGQSFSLSEISLKVNPSVAEFILTNSAGQTLYSFGNKAACGTGCSLVFQNDGNLVLYTGSGAVWGSNTYGNFQGKLILQNVTPYLRVQKDDGTVGWKSN